MKFLEELVILVTPLANHAKSWWHRDASGSRLQDEIVKQIRHRQGFRCEFVPNRPVEQERRNSVTIQVVCGFNQTCCYVVETAEEADAGATTPANLQCEILPVMRS